MVFDLAWVFIYIMINDRVMSELVWKSYNCFYLTCFLHLDVFPFPAYKYP